MPPAWPTSRCRIDFGGNLWISPLLASGLWITTCRQARILANRGFVCSFGCWDTQNCRQIGAASESDSQRGGGGLRGGGKRVGYPRQGGVVVRGGEEPRLVSGRRQVDAR